MSRLPAIEPVSPQLIFVNRVYWPEEAATAQLLHDLSRALAAREVPVRVITGRDRGQPRRELIDGVAVRRVHPLVARRPHVLSQAGNYAGFLLGAAAAVRAEARPGDVVVAMTDPPLLGVAVAAALARRRTRLWHWCQDVYPELAMGVAGAGLTCELLRRLQPVRDRAWRAAEGCAVLGSDMAALLERRGIARERISTVPNWAPGEIRPDDGREARRRWGIGNEFVVTYSGNLGRAHILEPVLDVAERLRTRPDILVLFIGDGAQRPRLESSVRARRLPNVRFLPPQPRATLSEALSAADLHLVTLRPGCEGTVWPSKFYGVIAAERPVLYIGPPAAEVANLVSSNALGASFGSGEADAIAEFVTNLADHPARLNELRGAVRSFGATLPQVEAAAAHWARVLAGAGAP